MPPQPRDEVHLKPGKAPSPSMPPSSGALGDPSSLSSLVPASSHASASIRSPSPSGKSSSSASSSLYLRPPSPSLQPSLGALANLQSTSSLVRSSTSSSPSSHPRSFLPSHLPAQIHLPPGPLTNLRSPSPSRQALLSSPLATGMPSPAAGRSPSGSLSQGRTLSPSIRNSSMGLNPTQHSSTASQAPTGSPRSRSQSLSLLSKAQKLHTGISKVATSTSTGLDAQGPVIFSDIASDSVFEPIHVGGPVHGGGIEEDSKHNKENGHKKPVQDPPLGSSAKPPISSRARAKTAKGD